MPVDLLLLICLVLLLSVLLVVTLPPAVAGDARVPMRMCAAGAGVRCEGAGGRVPGADQEGVQHAGCERWVQAAWLGHQTTAGGGGCAGAGAQAQLHPCLCCSLHTVAQYPWSVSLTPFGPSLRNILYGFGVVNVSAVR